MADDEKKAAFLTETDAPPLLRCHPLGF